MGLSITQLYGSRDSGSSNTTTNNTTRSGGNRRSGGGNRSSGGSRSGGGRRSGGGPRRDAGGRIISFDPRFPNRKNPHRPGTRRWSQWESDQRGYDANQIRLDNLRIADLSAEQSERFFAENMGAANERFAIQLAVQQKQFKKTFKLQKKQFKQSRKQQKQQFQKSLKENRRLAKEAEINANRARAAQVVEDPNAGLLRRRSVDVQRRVASTRGTDRLRISTNKI